MSSATVSALNKGIASKKVSVLKTQSSPIHQKGLSLELTLERGQY